jgi:hypothetical protein
MSVKLGKAKAQNGGKRNFFSFKDGDNVYMVLPPLGDLADKGEWRTYLSVHYGYKDSKGTHKPFLSTEKINYKTKMVEVPDAASDRVKQIGAEYDAAVASRNVEEAKRLKSLKEKYNLDKKFYVNAMTLNGELGILKVPYKSMKALDIEIARQKAAGVDIMDPENGRFMVFRRAGTGLDTIHQVLTHTEMVTINGKKYPDEKVATLDDSVMARLSTEVSLNLNNIFRSITPEQVALVVEADKSGDLSVIDSIFGSGDSVESAPVEVDDIPENKPTAAKTATVQAAKTEAPKAETKVAKSTVAAPAPDVSGMTDDDFFAMIK